MRPSIASTISIFLMAMYCGAATIRFDRSDHGPANPLKIGRATVTGVWFFGGVDLGTFQTVRGSGLGSNLAGIPDSLDGGVHYREGELYHRSGGEVMNISVEGGSINSITFRAHYSVITPGPVFTYNFYLALFPVGIGGSPYVISIAPDAGEFTVDLHALLTRESFSAINLWIESDEPFQHRLEGYTPEETYTHGVTIVAIDYSPVRKP